MKIKDAMQLLGTRHHRDSAGKTSVHHGDLMLACIRSASNPHRGGHRHGGGPISIPEMVAWDRRNR